MPQLPIAIKYNLELLRDFYQNNTRTINLLGTASVYASIKTIANSVGNKDLEFFLDAAAPLAAGSFAWWSAKFDGASDSIKDVVKGLGATVIGGITGLQVGEYFGSTNDIGEYRPLIGLTVGSLGALVLSTYKSSREQRKRPEPELRGSGNMW